MQTQSHGSVQQTLPQQQYLPIYLTHTRPRAMAACSRLFPSSRLFPTATLHSPNNNSIYLTPTTCRPRAMAVCSRLFPTATLQPYLMPNWQRALGSSARIRSTNLQKKNAVNFSRRMNLCAHQKCRFLSFNHSTGLKCKDILLADAISAWESGGDNTITHHLTTSLTTHLAVGKCFFTLCSSNSLSKVMSLTPLLAA